MNPSHEKKKTRPYWSNGFSTGIDLAFLLLGLTSGGATRSLKKVAAIARIGRTVRRDEYKKSKGQIQTNYIGMPSFCKPCSTKKQNKLLERRLIMTHEATITDISHLAGP